MVSETAQLVRRVHPVPVAMVCDQLTLLLEAFPVVALKTGMLVSAAHVRAVARILQDHRRLQLVVDPVMIASSGAELLEPGALAAYRKWLLPMARVITPNLPEAEALLGERITDEASLESAARRLSQQFGTAVLLKGGHLPGPDCLDVLVDQGELHRFRVRRVAVGASHGTGCTLSAAITAALAQGQALPCAVQHAKTYLTQTLLQSYTFAAPGGGLLHALNQGTRLENPSPAKTMRDSLPEIPTLA